LTGVLGCTCNEDFSLSRYRSSVYGRFADYAPLILFSPSKRARSSSPDEMKFFQICSKFGKNWIYLPKKRVQREQFICALRNRRERKIQGERGGRSVAKCSINESCSSRERSGSFEAPFVADSGAILKGRYLRLCTGCHSPLVRVHSAFGEQAPRPLCCAECTRERTAARERTRRRACSLAAQTAHNYSSRFVLAR